MRLWLNSDCLPAATRVIFGLENEAPFLHFDDADVAVFRILAHVGGGHEQHAGVFLPSHADAGRLREDRRTSPLRWDGDGISAVF